MVGWNSYNAMQWLWKNYRLNGKMIVTTALGCDGIAVLLGKGLSAQMPLQWLRSNPQSLQTATIAIFSQGNPRPSCQM